MFRLLSLLMGLALMAVLWLMVAERALPSGRCGSGDTTTTMVSVPRSLQALVDDCP